MSDDTTTDLTREQKIDALLDVAKFNPWFTVLIITLALFTALLEGIGISFVVPVLELIQNPGATDQAGGLRGLFISIYEFLGIPFTLEFVIIGVSTILTIRYTMSFVVAWFREELRTKYVRDLQMRAFERALVAKVEYFDREGSDDILNAIITQTWYASRSIAQIIKIATQVFLSMMYLSVGIIIAPVLTVVGVVVLGGVTIVMRTVVSSGFDLGDRIAEANERRQEAAQAGTQGIRDIRVFGIEAELLEYFTESVDLFTRTQIIQRRNKAGINNFYNLAVAVSIFVLIYMSFTFLNLSLGELGLFLFAMFRLGPRVSNLNQMYYQFENQLPHLIRTKEFIEELEQNDEKRSGTEQVPDEVTPVEFDDVWFGYNEEDVLRGINFEINKGEYIAFVGPSGSGKSTIVSLLSRLYDYDRGEITANGISIDQMKMDEWRDHITVVRQDPFLFNDTLKRNLTVGNRDATEREIERACAIARVDEFLDDLPDGYDTLLGDDGVRLSGGQKQRVAIARSLLEDADLLILDEATSDLDSNLERDVQRAIEEMERDYAVITIAHRLSTVENADRIHTLEGGRITEVGTHRELVNAGGTYAELHAIQST